jgi:alpha-1,3/alpha-1,6-mannosyltransferase
MSASSASSSPLVVYFLHPDLGIGGAERLIVDASLGLQSLGHSVHLFTSHHDNKCAFQETKDGTLKVSSYGDWLPTSLFGRFKLLFSMIRQLVLTLSIFLFYPLPDVFVVDQLALAIPILRLFSSARILFYCHFPDLLLSPRTSLLKSFYRLPFDCLEYFCTSQAHKILVNSAFTKQIFFTTFPHISLFSHHTPSTVEIVYPSINFSHYEPKANFSWTDEKTSEIMKTMKNRQLFTSINRFERKKNVELAIQAFAMVKQQRKETSSDSHLALLIAGGYDQLNQENVAYYPYLQHCAKLAGLTISDYPITTGDVIFLRSFSESERYFLFQNSLSILYTPANEHFGIVPIEAMFNQRIVIAVNSGGPLESIEHGITGYLEAGLTENFARAMTKVLDLTPQQRKIMGEAGKERVIKKFSFQSFTNRLNEIVRALAEEREVQMGREREEFPTNPLLCLLLGVTLIAAGMGLAWE